MTRPDAEVVHAWEERSAIIEADARQPRSVAEEMAAAEFTGREGMIVAIHRAKIKAARDAKQRGLFS